MRAHGWIVGAGALLAGLAVLALGLELAGYDAGPALGALWSGAFGSCRYKLTGLEKNRAEYERLIEVCKAHDIGTE